MRLPGCVRVLLITLTALAVPACGGSNGSTDSAPAAQNQGQTLKQGSSKAITLSATDPENQPINYSIVTLPPNGSLSGVPPSVTYTPSPAFSGVDVFTFQASDGTLLSNVATVTLTVTPNSAPVAQDQAQGLLRDEAKAIALVAVDAEGDPITYSIVAGPSKGILSGAAPNVTYTPTPGFTGTDSFTFQAGDGLLSGNIATVSLTVNVPTADHLSFVRPPSLREQQNVLFSVFTVEVKDSLNRTLTSDNSTQVTLMLDSGTGSLGGVLTVTALNGIAIFEGVTYNMVQGILLKAGSAPALPFPGAAVGVDVQAGPSAGRAIVRASLPSGGGEWGESALFPMLSGDGRYVSFIQSSNLFVRDTVSGLTETLVDNVIESAPMSANGRFVTYRRVLGQVRVYDRQTGLEEFVSVGSDGTPANAGGVEPSISASGRYVVFASDATNLVPGDTNGRRDIYLRDRVLGVTRRVSVGADGTEPNHDSRLPAISGNGRFVAFQSESSNLVPDTNGGNDVFVKDLETGEVERLDSYSMLERPAISFDGRFVAYSAKTSDLVDPSNLRSDVYVYDRQSGELKEVLARDGGLGNNDTGSPSISGDGRYVAFASEASNMVPWDANSSKDVFVHDFLTGTTSMVSVKSSGLQVNGPSFDPCLSLDGRFVAFHSDATDLVTGDTNLAKDVFVGPNPPPVPLPPSQLSFSVQPVATPAGASILPAVRVLVQDSAGATVAAASNPITIEIGTNPSAGTLVGTLTVNAIGGQAIFNDLFLDAPGSGYTLRATSPGLASATSIPFDILVPAPPDHLSFGVPPSIREQQNVGFSYFTVEVRDVANQLIRSDNSTQVTVTLMSGTGALAGTLTRTVAEGMAVFDDVAYDVVGLLVLGATGSPALSLAGPGATVDVKAGPASELPMFLASVPTGGGQWPNGAHSCSLSADGRYAVFLHPPGIFVRDTVDGVTEQLPAITSVVPSISGNGRFVAYARSVGSVSQIFVYDRQTGTEDPVSLSTDGVSGNGESQGPSISADGRFVAFHSAATNLVPGDNNGQLDVFLRDRLRKETIRLSVSAAGVEGDHESLLPSISGNGRFVAFQSLAYNLVPNDLNAYDVFVYDRLTKQLERIVAQSTVDRPAISFDGRFVVFTANTTDVINPTNSKIDVYRFDRQTSAMTEISMGLGGVLANDHSWTPSISGNGRYVAFSSDATNLVADDTNAWRDIFVYDAQSGTIVRASVGAAGQQGQGPSFAPALSSDGRFLGFHSIAENLVGGDTNGAVDILIRSNP